MADTLPIEVKVTMSYDEYYSFWKNEESSYSDMNDMNMLGLIQMVDFRIFKEEDGYRVEDIQDANLGDIESERFETVEEICGRIEHYFNDYFEEY